MTTTLHIIYNITHYIQHYTLYTILHIIYNITHYIQYYTLYTILHIIYNITHYIQHYTLYAILHIIYNITHFTHYNITLLCITSEQSAQCLDAVQTCFGDDDCSEYFINYDLECQGTLNQLDECSNECKDSYNLLMAVCG